MTSPPVANTVAPGRLPWKRHEPLATSQYPTPVGAAAMPTTGWYIGNPDDPPR